VPFTFNQVPRNPADYTYGNKFAITAFYMKLHEDFEMAIKDNSEASKYLKD
jgi:hypothetical protein